jgi:hypothetical protein
MYFQGNKVREQHNLNLNSTWSLLSEFCPGQVQGHPWRPWAKGNVEAAIWELWFNSGIAQSYISGFPSAENLAPL